ncbi:phosphatase PAP2 family protein [uncultured Jatrophihabitans sp.]|uniref:phosphatase PAP2 family protein n=1 Tax=uncultured Jatrophihabitans sp. TaxID=1610747 RepID=UPI0035CB554E
MTSQTRLQRPGWLTDEVLRGMRWGLVLTWIGVFAAQCVLHGIPYFRSDLLVWLATLLLACTFGRRAMFYVLVDFVPLATVLVGYDYLRNLADTMGMPTWWHPQLDVDRFLFFGNVPSVWLQAHLRHVDVRWYDVLVSLCYFSFFLAPYVTAAALWLRRRAEFYRWSLRFVALSFLGFGFFALIPSAPPWAAALCSSADVAQHPNSPPCLTYGDPASGGLLGRMQHNRPGTHPWIDRISTRGFDDLHLRFAGSVIRAGQGGVDLIAAVPSLHIGGTTLLALFLWSRVRARWRPLLVAYVLVMAFSLVYSGEHYVSDCLAGALLAVLVHVAGLRIERRLAARRTPRVDADTLGTQQHRPADQQEQQCPPTRQNATPPSAPPHAMTPSST